MSSARLLPKALVGVAVLACLVLGWWLFSPASPETQPLSPPTPAPSAASSRTSPATTTTSGSSSADAATPDDPQSSKQVITRDEATKIYVRRMMHDPSFEGWTPLSFYGQVVDDAGQPIAGATASLGWSTNGVLGSYAKRQVISDAQGRFSVTGKHGKHLSVRVEKTGYDTVGGAQGNFFYEYADPGSPEYHQPSERHPIVFSLRRKGPGAVVQSKSLRVKLYPDHPQTQVNFLTGYLQPDGQLTVAVDKPDYRTAGGRFPWSVALSIAQGGLIATDEQFPFLAPAYGYAPTVRIDMTATAQPDYSTRATRTYYFYLQATNTYGHVTVNTIGSVPTVNISYVYNPQPGNRVLEPAATPKP